MNYTEVLEQAKKNMGTLCKSCEVCNGRACKNSIPGPGAKGVGDVAIRNYDMWKEYRLQMDTLVEHKPVDTSVELFGKSFALPVFAGPVGAVSMHYGDLYDDKQYNDILVHACAENGIAAFTGDGMDANVMISATQAISKEGGLGIPTVKPWNYQMVAEKMDLVRTSDAFAVAMDVDAAGLPFLKGFNPPAGSKSVQELAEIIKLTEKPFIVKGIMTVNGARKALEAGASAIVVSNHGGRVLDQTPSTAEVLPEIAKAVKGKLTILVDGGIRSGADVLKALALGADGVVIARPFVNAVYGGREEGVKLYVEKIKGELEDAMAMCGVFCINDITEDLIWRK